MYTDLCLLLSTAFPRPSLYNCLFYYIIVSTEAGSIWTELLSELEECI